MNEHDPYTKTVRLSNAQRQKILDKLDHSQVVASEKLQPGKNRRSEPRYVFRPGDLPIIVKQPGGELTRLSVPVRNISSGGIAFLHGGFLYVGSHCSIQLSANADSMIVNGEIVNCRHVEGLLHEIGVKFDTPIDPGLFVSTNKSSEDSG